MKKAFGVTSGSWEGLWEAFLHWNWLSIIPRELNGIIIESGFPSVVRIITHLGVPAPGIPLEAIDQACLKMIQEIVVPTLVIHGERDTLVPLKEAEDTLSTFRHKRKGVGHYSRCDPQ